MHDARWTCRFDAVVAIPNAIQEILSTVETINQEDHAADRRVEAGGLLAQVETFKFILVLAVLVKMLSITKRLSDQLQDSSLNLATAGRLIEYVISSLRSGREDRDWECT